jgi:hypothetical protein
MHLPYILQLAPAGTHVSLFSVARSILHVWYICWSTLIPVVLVESDVAEW